MRRFGWSLEQLLKELRAEYRAGTTITFPGLRARGRDDLASAITAHRAGIGELRKLACIPAPPRTYRHTAPTRGWTADAVVAAIVVRHRAGESLAARDVPRTLFGAARTHLGSWRAAVEAAGVDYAAVQLVRGPYSKADICAELRELRATQARLTWAELRALPIARRAARRFGSLKAAIAAAQLQRWPTR